LESAVDLIAGELAFYPPIFLPVLQEEIERGGRLSFACIESARARATPDASPVCRGNSKYTTLRDAGMFGGVDLGYKKGESSAAQLPPD
jgi:hypothetical protein